MARFDPVSIFVEFRRSEKPFCRARSEKNRRQNFHLAEKEIYAKAEKVCLNLQKRETCTESALAKALINASAHGAEGMREQRTRHMSCLDKET
jgi:hypothetical protein